MFLNTAVKSITQNKLKNVDSYMTQFINVQD